MHHFLVFLFESQSSDMDGLRGRNSSQYFDYTTTSTLRIEDLGYWAISHTYIPPYILADFTAQPSYFSMLILDVHDVVLVHRSLMFFIICSLVCVCNFVCMC